MPKSDAETKNPATWETFDRILERHLRAAPATMGEALVNVLDTARLCGLWIAAHTGDPEPKPADIIALTKLVLDHREHDIQRAHEDAREVIE